MCMYVFNIIVLFYYTIKCINFRFYIILDGSVGIYIDVKKDEKMIISADNYTFPLPLPRRMSQISTSDKDGSEDLSSDPNQDTFPPSSSKGCRREVRFLKKKKREKENRLFYYHINERRRHFRHWPEMNRRGTNFKTRNKMCIIKECSMHFRKH